MNEYTIIKQIRGIENTISGYRNKRSNVSLELQIMESALTEIKLVYEEHCSIYDSVDVSNLSEGYGLELIIGEEIGTLASEKLSGYSERICRNQIMKDELSVSNKITYLEGVISSYDSKIASSYNEIDRLEREIAVISADN